MRRFVRIAALPVMLILGLALGLGLKAVLSAPKVDDVCHGQGSLERDITVASDGGKTYHVCTKLGQRVIFDAAGTPVDQTVYDDQLAQYYAQNPDQNPRLIAEKTAAAVAADAFMNVDLPVPGNKDCPDGSVRNAFPEVAISLCVPDGWKPQADTAGIAIGNDNLIVGVFPVTMKDTFGTHCPSPQQVQLASGTLKVCASKVGGLGGQAFGLVYPSGREGGFSIYASASQAERDLAFQVAYSMEEKR